MSGKQISGSRQGGIALLAVMVMMIAISLFGVAVMNMGGLEQRISGNFQLLRESFETTEGVVAATISLSGDSDDPFDGPGATYPVDLTTLDTVPGAIQAMTASLEGSGDLDASVDLVEADIPCPRSESATGVYWSNCDLYHVDAAHTNTDVGVERNVTQHAVQEVTKQ